MTPLTAEELDRLARFAKRRWGLDIDERKRVIVENRLHSLSRRVRFESVVSLIDGLERSPRPEMELALFDVLSTNHTTFFRESVHFDLLLDDLRARERFRRGNGIRLWSAGCSNGCEPYTLSILMHEEMDDPAARDCRILGTDLSTGVLADARRGVYTDKHVAPVTDERLRRHFDSTGSGPTGHHAIRHHVRSLVSFGLLNLLEPWKMSGPFDAIFCRNVMIYFDAETREALARRFLDLLAPGGLFFLGTAETLTGTDLPAEQIGVAAYRRTGSVR